MFSSNGITHHLNEGWPNLDKAFRLLISEENILLVPYILVYRPIYSMISSIIIEIHVFM